MLSVALIAVTKPLNVRFQCIHALSAPVVLGIASNRSGRRNFSMMTDRLWLFTFEDCSIVDHEQQIRMTLRRLFKSIY